MKAVVQHRYGSPDELELRDVEPPAVAGDEVLVAAPLDAGPSAEDLLVGRAAAEPPEGVERELPGAEAVPREGRSLCSRVTGRPS